MPRLRLASEWVRRLLRLVTTPITVPRPANGATTLIIPMPARPMATTDLAGFRAASSSAQAPGTTGAGAAVGADTAIAAATDTVAAMDMVDTAAVTPTADAATQ